MNGEEQVDKITRVTVTISSNYTIRWFTGPSDTGKPYAVFRPLNSIGTLFGIYV